MKCTPWPRRDEPLDCAELARLLPAPGDPELSPGRLTRLEEHLMSEIQQHVERRAGRHEGESEGEGGGERGGVERDGGRTRR